MKLDTLGQRLRYARTIAGMTQEELAAKAGTTQDAITKIERDIIKRPKDLEAIAKVLNVSPAWLQFGIEQLDKLNKEAIEFALRFAELTEQQKAALKALIQTFLNSNT